MRRAPSVHHGAVSAHPLWARSLITVSDERGAIYRDWGMRCGTSYYYGIHLWDPRLWEPVSHIRGLEKGEIYLHWCGAQGALRWSERISILPSPFGHTRLGIAEEFLGSCAVAGLLFIANRRLRVPVHNKLPIRHGQMIVFGPGSVNITFVRPRFRRLLLRLRITSAEWIRNSSLLALLNRCIFIRQETSWWTTKTVVSLKAKGVDRKWTNSWVSGSIQIFDKR